MNVKVNDIVRFLNDVGGGRVTRIEGKTVYVEDEDGFERPVLERELVVVGQAGSPEDLAHRVIIPGVIQDLPAALDDRAQEPFRDLVGQTRL